MRSNCTLPEYASSGGNPGDMGVDLAEELSVEFGGNVPIAWECERDHCAVGVGGRDLGQEYRFERGKVEARWLCGRELP